MGRARRRPERRAAAAPALFHLRVELLLGAGRAVEDHVRRLAAVLAVRAMGPPAASVDGAHARAARAREHVHGAADNHLFPAPVHALILGSQAWVHHWPNGEAASAVAGRRALQCVLGGVPERSNGAVLKTVGRPKRPLGSNPSPAVASKPNPAQPSGIRRLPTRLDRRHEGPLRTAVNRSAGVFTGPRLARTAPQPGAARAAVSPATMDCLSAWSRLERLRDAQA